MLINSLLDQPTLLAKLGLVIVDEIHMLGSERGVALEDMLTKMLYLRMPSSIVAMSATIQNITEIAQFLRAEVFARSFRPVELCELVKIGQRLFTVEQIRKKVYRHSRQLDATSEDGMLVELVKETLPACCLVFCPTRRACEVTAKKLAAAMPALTPAEVELRGRRQHLLHQLQLTVGEEQRTVTRGVAFHHAGLSHEERGLIEEAYTQGKKKNTRCTNESCICTHGIFRLFFILFFCCIYI